MNTTQRKPMYIVGDRVVINIVTADDKSYDGHHGTITELVGNIYSYDRSFEGSPDYRVRLDDNRGVVLIWEFNLRPEYELVDIKPNVSFIKSLFGDEK